MSYDCCSCGPGVIILNSTTVNATSIVRSKHEMLKVESLKAMKACHLDAECVCSVIHSYGKCNCERVMVSH